MELRCLLSERRGKLRLSGAWDDFSAHAEGDCVIRSNICSTTPAGREVRNELSGEVIGHVGGMCPETGTLTIAGRQHRILRKDECIVVAPVTHEQADEREDTPQYCGRRRRVSQSFAAHVRHGCGLGQAEAPIVRVGGHLLWFHFGGENYEELLRQLFPLLLDTPAIAGIAIRVTAGFDASAVTELDCVRVKRCVAEMGVRLLDDEGIGRFGQHLPALAVECLLNELRFTERFAYWLRTRTRPRPYPSMP